MVPIFFSPLISARFSEKDVVARTSGLIERLVREGKISQTRIDESYRRIQHLKRGLVAANLSATINRE